MLLREDILNPREHAGQVYVPAGTVGEIFALNWDENARFCVQFPRFPNRVTVLLEKLEVFP